MIQKIFCTRALLLVFALSTLWSGYARSQTPAPFKSAFEGYNAYSDDPVAGWKAANDEVARIGGWRAYAKQVQLPENTPLPAAKAGELAPKATP